MPLYCLPAFRHVCHIVVQAAAPSFEVVVGMIGDRVTASQYLSEHLRMLVYVLANHEECPFHPVSFQNLQHLWRHLGDRSVIEGKISNSPSPPLP